MDRSAFYEFLKNGPVALPNAFEAASEDHSDSTDLFKALDISKCRGYCRPSMRDMVAQGERKYVFASLPEMAADTTEECQGCKLIAKSAEAVLGHSFTPPPRKLDIESEGRIVPIRIYGKIYVQTVYPDEPKEDASIDKEGICYVLDPFIRFMTGTWGGGKNDLSLGARWELFVDPSVHKGFRQVPQFSQPSGDTASFSAFVRATSWLQECELRHSCNAKKIASAENTVPQRLLDVKHGGLFNKVKVMDTTGLTWDSLGPYVCLSHCWGEAATIIKTTKATLDDHLRGIDVRSLPQTFQDAIVFTRKLGMRFLWIDSLCIVQDDTEDWEKEAEKMASVYSNARLTLAAASARDSRDGLFSSAPAPEKRRVDIRGIDVGDRELYVRQVLPHFAFDKFGWVESANLPLLGRGWVLQERLLSPRILYFSERELFWECMESTWCECGGITSDETRKAPVMKKSEFGASWHRIIEAYTSLNLTKQSDKLPALSGIASQFHTLRGKHTYLGGIWSNDLPDGLQWSVCEDEILVARTKLYAPTWSWSSVPNRVEFRDEDSRCNDSSFTLVGSIFNIKLEDCAAQPKGLNKYGHMEYCSLLFEGGGGMGFVQSRLSAKGGGKTNKEAPFRIRLANAKTLTMFADYDLSQDPDFDFKIVESGQEARSEAGIEEVDGADTWNSEASQMVFLIHLCTRFFYSNMYSSIFPTAPRPYNRSLVYLVLKLIRKDVVDESGPRRLVYFERLGLAWTEVEELVECTRSMDPVDSIVNGRLKMQHVARNDDLYNPNDEALVHLR